MILGECAVFAAMFAAGAAAETIAFCLNVFGKVGRAARVVTEVLTAAVMGIFYFLTLYHAASGVFRLYSTVAFLLGVYVAYRLCRRLAPAIRRGIRRVLLPLLLAYNRASAQFAERIRPFREKTEARRENRRARRVEKRGKRLAVRAERRKEKRDRKEPEYRQKARRERRNARIVIDR